MARARERINPPVLVIGITGGAGSGKSSVAAIFRGLGARVVDADRIGHRLLRRDTRCYAKIVRAFGPGILGRRGAVDRRRLGDLVFSDVRLRRKLNRIVHPELVQNVKLHIDKLKSRRGGPVVVDAALLADWGLHRDMDRVVAVVAPAGVRLKRLMDKGVPPGKARGMMAAQLPPRRLRRLADEVIENPGSKTALRRRAVAAWGRMAKKVANKPGML